MTRQSWKALSRDSELSCIVEEPVFVSAPFRISCQHAHAQCSTTRAAARAGVRLFIIIGAFFPGLSGDWWPCLPAVERERVLSRRTGISKEESNDAEEVPAERIA